MKTIDVTYNPQEDNAIVVLPDYPGQPIELFFNDGQFDFPDDYVPF